MHAKYEEPVSVIKKKKYQGVIKNQKVRKQDKIRIEHMQVPKWDSTRCTKE